MPGKLYLVPNAISEDSMEAIPSYIVSLIAPIRYFFVEEEKSARRLLKKLNPQFPLAECVFFELSEHTLLKEAQKFLEEAGNRDMGIISESGSPCIADPGREIVLWAHQHNREVVPLVGPSSISLALMASGLNGQNFAFNGYLPKERNERIPKIKALEKHSQLENQAQIFMETPYRNQALLDDIVSCCDPHTLLCVALDITGETQSIKTSTIKEWKKGQISLPKKPALFLMQKM